MTVPALTHLLCLTTALQDQRILRSEPLPTLHLSVYPRSGMSNSPIKALQAACEAGHEAEVRRLLQTHKHSSALQLLNSSCLSLAARGGHLGIVEVLLRQNDYLPPADGKVGSVRMCEWMKCELECDTLAAALTCRLS